MEHGWWEGSKGWVCARVCEVGRLLRGGCLGDFGGGRGGVRWDEVGSGSGVGWWRGTRGRWRWRLGGEVGMGRGCEGFHEVDLWLGANENCCRRELSSHLRSMAL